MGYIELVKSQFITSSRHTPNTVTITTLRDMKYKITDKQHPQCHNLFRIEALTSFSGVEKGDLGGYIEKESNLSQEGECWVYDNAMVYSDARVFGNASISGEAMVYGNARVSDEAVVFGEARVFSKAMVFGKAKVSGNAMVFDDVRVFDDARVYGSVRVFDDAEVYGIARVFGIARVYGKASVYGDAMVYGDAVVSGNAKVYGKIDRGYLDKGHYYEKEFNLINLIDCSLGVLPINGILRVYKRVRKTLKAEFDNSFQYPEKGEVVCEDYDPDPLSSCSKGLHFSYSSYYPIREGYSILAADVHIDDVICCLDGKIRVKKATIIGVVEYDHT